MTNEWYERNRLEEMREQTKVMREIAEKLIFTQQMNEISKKQDEQIKLLEQLVSILGGNMDDGR